MLRNVLDLFMPGQAGALWLGLVVFTVVLADFKRPASARNLVLVALLGLAPLQVNLLSWSGDRAVVAFTAIFLATAAYAGWGLAMGCRSASSIAWQPNLPKSGLIWLLVLVVIVNIGVVIGRSPDDAGYYTNLGAQKWTETGSLPYADPQLKGPDSPAYGAAATYGPLLYAAHLPFQLAMGPPGNPSDLSPMDPTYEWPPVLATQLASLSFFLLALFAVFRIVSTRAGESLGLTGTILFASSPYVIGLGSDDLVITGLRFISHIAPTAAVLAAFACLGRPRVAGALLAAGAGLLYYPAFLMPAWLAWYLGRNRREAWRFLLGFGLTGAAIALLVVLFTPTGPDESVVRLFMESTLEHQEGRGEREYGASEFSFWGTHPDLAGFWQEPLFGSGSLFKPSFLLYLLLVGLCSFLARGRSSAQLAGLTACLAAAVQLWKTHATGTYVEWYLPFLIVAVLTHTRAAGDDALRPDKV